MRTRIAAAVAAAFVVVTATVAVAVTVDDPGDNVGVRSMMSPERQDQRWGGGWQRGWMRGMPGMMQDSQVRSEYSYLVEMVAHHREAVRAAEELQRSERPRMRAFGRSIVTSQTAQIEQMEGWLAEWYPDRSGSTPYQPMMRELSSLSGDRLDRVFLQDMTVHHMAAVMMSHQLLVRGLAEHRQTASLARTIAGDQRAEIVQMQRWLRQWFGQGAMHRYGWGHGGWGSGEMMGPGMMAR